MQTLKKILFFLTFQERKYAFFMLGLIIIMAFLDMLGVASIVPFIAVLSNPELVETNSILNTAYRASKNFGLKTPDQFLFALGILVFIMLVFSLSFKALATYVQASFTMRCEYSISRRLIEGYLHQPYTWFLSRNSADLSKNILSEVEEIVFTGINPMIGLITHSTISIAIVSLLIFVDPKIAIIVALTLGSSYIFVFKFVRRIVTQIGLQRLKNNETRFTSVSEAFGAFKELKVRGLEQFYIDRFSVSAKIFAKNKAVLSILSQLPRYILELIAFGGVLLLVLYLMNQTSNVENILPILALYVFAGYRLMPALQQIYGAISQLRYIAPALDNLRDDIVNLKPDNLDQDQGTLSLKKAITLNHIHYNYPNVLRTALKDIHITIPAYSTVGFVGATGSGKTTIVDVILGLLNCQKGSLEVDGKVIEKNNLRSWQRSIGYVPQQIYLADDTIAGNIALGIDSKKIDQKAVESAAKIANIHEFVVNELPLQYQTTVGERGIRLSGGQLQRIGIARALYNKPKVLIMDEATSALDNITEKEVMEAVNKASLNTTIILIAHRISTVKECDIIFLLENGELKVQGTFEQLKKSNNYFREISKNY
jgi:ABC-type multidrug transport system fused ATPase/permease subunit